MSRRLLAKPDVESLMTFLNPCGRMSFHELKMAALHDILKLRQTGLISKSDKYQALLDSIAQDIRSKRESRLSWILTVAPEMLISRFNALNRSSASSASERNRDYASYVGQLASKAVLPSGSNQELPCIYRSIDGFDSEKEVSRLGTDPDLEARVFHLPTASIWINLTAKNELFYRGPCKGCINVNLTGLASLTNTARTSIQLKHCTTAVSCFRSINSRPSSSTRSA